MPKKFKHKLTNQIVSDVEGSMYSVKSKEESFAFNFVPDWVIRNSSEWEEVKEPLFTTEDGVDIHKGDKYWFIDIHNNVYSFTAGSCFIDYKKKSSLKRFSTKEAAEEYLKKSKPLFTTEDGVDIYRGDEYWFIDSDSDIYSFTAGSCFIDYKKKSSLKRFSTKEAAENYLKCHNPSLTYSEVLELFDGLFSTETSSRKLFKKGLTQLVKDKNERD